jgi:hypothetical protein
VGAVAAVAAVATVDTVHSGRIVGTGENCETVSVGAVWTVQTVGTGQ